MKKEFSAGLIVFRRTLQGPRFLLLYHGGRYWNFPKGHIEYNMKNVETSFGTTETVETAETNVRETSKEAAIRETFEETGLAPEKVSIKKGFRAVEKFRFFKNREQIFKVVIFYLAETDEVDVKISSEHEGFGWFLYKDARYILAPYKDSQKLLRNAYEFIRPPRPATQKPSFLQKNYGEVKPPSGDVRRNAPRVFRENPLKRSRPEIGEPGK
jgi:8-oxo-dGTP pyrophosphatase MutT (NUDIX family)